MDTPNIRLAGREDLAAINEIYNHYVLHSTCTYQIEPEPMAGRVEWFEAHDRLHPITVAELDGQVVGWGSLSAFHRRVAYRHTLENSVYVRHDLHHRGLGQALLVDLIDRAKALGHHSIIALISADQIPSIKLHEKLGFSQVAYLKEVGFKFERWLDVVYHQMLLWARSA